MYVYYEVPNILKQKNKKQDQLQITIHLSPRKFIEMYLFVY